MNGLQRYTPILKTTSAELKGLRELSEGVKDCITPIFELTRSRKTKADSEGDINQQLRHVESAFGKRSFILDLTGHPKHRNSQIKALQASADGYADWVSFLRRKKRTFPNLVPALQINDEDVDTSEEFYRRLRRQVSRLRDEFGVLAYRLPFDYEDIAEDLKHIKSELAPERLIAVVDAGFIPQNKANEYGRSATITAKSLIAEGIEAIAIAGSSFPQNPTQYGDDDKGEFDLEEIRFFGKVQQNARRPFVYGDYGTIHPAPSLQAGGHGWVARIDLPCKDSILYRRQRKKKSERTYENAYITVGREIVRLSEFSAINDLTGACWGIEQIQTAADGHPPALSPSNWISARINIHISVRVATM